MRNNGGRREIHWVKLDQYLYRTSARFVQYIKTLTSLTLPLEFFFQYDESQMANGPSKANVTSNNSNSSSTNANTQKPKPTSVQVRPCDDEQKTPF